MNYYQQIQNIGKNAYKFLSEKVSETPEGINFNPDNLDLYEADLPIINGYMKNANVETFKVSRIVTDRDMICAHGESLETGADMVVRLQDLDVEGLCCLADWISE